MSDSLVHPDALNEVFDVVDVNGDGVLTVHEFISVRLCQFFFVLPFATRAERTHTHTHVLLPPPPPLLLC